MIIECPKCGAVNRIPDLIEPSENHFCTACNSSLNRVPKTNFAQRVESAIRQDVPSKKHVYVPLSLIILVGILSTIYHRLPFYFCYSDIWPWYYGPFYDTSIELGMPYITELNEYPVLTGLFIYFTRLVGQTQDGYYLLSAFLLILFAAVATYLLYRIIQERTDIKVIYIYWILAPTMFFFLVFNWDMIAVMFVVVAFYFMRKDRDYVASAFLALGFCSKLYPILFLLPLLLKKRRPGEWIKIAGIFGAVSLTINLPFMLSNFEGWYFIIDFQSQRPPNPDSIWGVIHSLAPQLSITYINAISFLLLAVSSIVVVWKYRHESTIKLCLILTILFLIFNKIFSPQHLLWLLPLFALLPMKKRKLFYALELSNLIVLFTILCYLLTNLQACSSLIAVNSFVVIRHILLIFLLLDVLGLTSCFYQKWRAFRHSDGKSGYSDTVPLVVKLSRHWSIETDRQVQGSGIAEGKID